MSAKQKRRLKRDRELLKLGRGAKEAIGAVQGELAASRAEAARALELAQRTSATADRVVSAKEAELEAAIADASSAGEVIRLLRERITGLERERDQVVAEAVKQHGDKWGEAVDALHEKHATSIASLEACHAKEAGILQRQVADADTRAERYKREWEEPAKLRRRLQDKERENQELRTELSRLKGAPPEEIRVHIGSLAGR